MLWHSFIYHVHSTCRQTTAAIIRRHCNNINSEVRERPVLAIPWKLNILLFSLIELLFNRNKLLLNLNKLLFKLNKLLFSPNELLFNRNKLLLNLNKLLFQPNKLLFFLNKLFSTRINYNYIGINYYSTWKKLLFNPNKIFYPKKILLNVNKILLIMNELLFNHNKLFLNILLLFNKNKLLLNPSKVLFNLNKLFQNVLLFNQNKLLLNSSKLLFTWINYSWIYYYSTRINYYWTWVNYYVCDNQGAGNDRRRLRVGTLHIWGALTSLEVQISSLNPLGGVLLWVVSHLPPVGGTQASGQYVHKRVVAKTWQLL